MTGRLSSQQDSLSPNILGRLSSQQDSLSLIPGRPLCPAWSLTHREAYPTVTHTGSIPTVTHTQGGIPGWYIPTREAYPGSTYPPGRLYRLVYTHREAIPPGIHTQGSMYPLYTLREACTLSTHPGRLYPPVIPTRRLYPPVIPTREAYIPWYTHQGSIYTTVRHPKTAASRLPLTRFTVGQ